MVLSHVACDLELNLTLGHHLTRDFPFVLSLVLSVITMKEFKQVLALVTIPEVQ